ncbi:MAG: hypothetical protein M3Y77_15645 [Actinomycetota bacterium]|nr:hypothetical protein [Actinomycetota bacterium]
MGPPGTGGVAVGGMVDGAVVDGAVVDGAVVGDAVVDGAVVGDAVVDGAVVGGAVVGGAAVDGPVDDCAGTTGDPLAGRALGAGAAEPVTACGPASSASTNASTPIATARAPNARTDPLDTMREEYVRVLGCSGIFRVSPAGCRAGRSAQRSRHPTTRASQVEIDLA